MNLDEVPSGVEIFIDANIFVYQFSGPTELTPACSAFLRRIEDHALQGFTSLSVVSEVLHRLMIIEATEMLAVEPRQTVRYLKEHPAEVKKLTKHVLVPGKIQALGVHILAPTLEDLLASQDGKLTFGFLTHDALHLAVMTRHRLTHIATNDPDFERVESLKVWRPAPQPPAARNAGVPGLAQR